MLFHRDIQQTNEIFESKNVVLKLRNYSFIYPLGTLRVTECKKLVQYSAQFLNITGSERSSKSFYT